MGVRCFNFVVKSIIPYYPCCLLFILKRSTAPSKLDKNDRVLAFN
jgi:hypothetical protein